MPSSSRVKAPSTSTSARPTRLPSPASWENQVRFLSFDFLYAVPPAGDVLLYLLDNGLTREEFTWFMEHDLGDRIVMGNDFYERNEQLVAPAGRFGRREVSGGRSSPASISSTAVP